MPLLTGGSLEEVREYTLKLIKEIGASGGLMMAADHSIPPNTIAENYIEGMIFRQSAPENANGSKGIRSGDNNPQRTDTTGT